MKRINLKTPAQVIEHRKGRYKIYCTTDYFGRAIVRRVRYRDGAFQVKTDGSRGWVTAERLWTYPKQPGEGETLYIYTLSDPRDNAPRYVGITKNLKVRKYTHNSCVGSTGKWVWELRRLGLRPVLTVIKEFPGKHASNAHPEEAECIKPYLDQGAQLLNRHTFGDSLGGHVLYRETRYMYRKHR